MKKLLTSLLIFVMALTLVSCKKDNNKDKTVITYAAWNLGDESKNNIERRMIKAFEDLNPKIKVNIIERPKIVDAEGSESDSSWDEFFNAQAAIGKMPDVFQIDQVIKGALNSWVSDISDIASLDSEFNLIPEDIRDAAKYGNKLFALPQALFYQGYFINRTIIKNEAGPNYVPKFGDSFDDLLVTAEKSAKNAIVGQDGIMGIDGMNDLALWLVAQHDENLGWFAYNGSGYSLNSDAFINAMAEQNKYFNESSKYQKYVLESANVYLKDKDQTITDLYGDGNLFETGHLAINWQGSYNLGHRLAATTDPNSSIPGLFGQDIDFIGTPSVTIDGVKHHKVPVIIDYIAIGQGTKHKEEAYKFAKWMSFSADGYRKRLEIANEFPSAGAVNFAPIVQDEQLLNEYFETYPSLVEFEKLVRSHDSFIIESLAKTVPGYVNSRWEGKYDADTTIGKMIDKIRDGEVAILDVIANLQTQANSYYNEEKERLEGILKG